jgi:3-oxoacyl-[acyl-carrier-protein] synthase-3
MLKNAAITGWGSYCPARVLDNLALEKLVHTSDEWIRSRTGIVERRIASPDETTGSMCLAAAKQALDRAGLQAADLDLVICGTTTPDYILPCTACLLQRQLGAERAGAFDINSACTGFLTALVTAAQFIQCGTYERILVTSGEVLSRVTDWQDRNTCVLFGDGAAAVVLEATFQDAGVMSTVLGSRGDVEHFLAIEAGGSARPASAETVATAQHCIHMRGNEVFKFAVRAMVQASREAMRKARLTPDDFDWVIPHQANGRIIDATQEALGVPPEKIFINIDRFGNTGAGSVSIALTEMLSTHPVNVGDNLLLVSFGGGLSWGAAVVRWADIAAIKRERNLAPAQPAIVG